MTWELRKLLPGHFWQTHAGCKTIILDRGAVQFDYPRSWVVQPDDGSVALFDRTPPADDSRLEVSYFRLPPIDLSDLPVADLIDRVTSKEREHATCGPLREEIRGGMELAWRDVNFAHAQSGRRACFRVCVARRGGVQCLITYEFWSRDRSRPDKIWQTVLETLVLDRVVRDPARGPSTERQ
jgi:hypothetical protein